MKVIAILPARFASTRLPGKMLLDRTGKPLIVHVVEAVRKATLVDEIVVATDDQRILEAVEAAGGRAVMTRVDHRSGSDRLAEAADILGLHDDDVVVNVQGDEPEMPASCIDRLVEMMLEAPEAANGNLLAASEDSTPAQHPREASRGLNGGHHTLPPAPMATLATPLDAATADDPNRVKVVLAHNGRAMYFSRSKIPHDRDRTGKTRYLLHLGIYAYRVWFLKTFTKLHPTPAEESEKLEQLRALEHGYNIQVAVVEYAGGGIDTPEDYEAFVRRQTR